MVLVEILIHVYDTLYLSGLFNSLHLSFVCHSCDISVFSSLSLCLCCGHLPRLLYSGYHLLGFGPKLMLPPHFWLYSLFPVALDFY